MTRSNLRAVHASPVAQAVGFVPRLDAMVGRYQALLSGVQRLPPGLIETIARSYARPLDPTAPGLRMQLHNWLLYMGCRVWAHNVKRTPLPGIYMLVEEVEDYRARHNVDPEPEVFIAEGPLSSAAR